jgi:hypothetical protein
LHSIPLSLDHSMISLFQLLVPTKHEPPLTLCCFVLLWLQLPCHGLHEPKIIFKLTLT